MNQLQQLNQILHRMRAWMVSFTGHPQFRTSLLAIALTLSCYSLFYWCSITHEPLFAGKSFSSEEIQKLEICFTNHGLRDYERHGTRFYVPIRSRQKYYDAIPEAGNAHPQKVTVQKSSSGELPPASEPES